jgi:hypothetical protein
MTQKDEVIEAAAPSKATQTNGDVHNDEDGKPQLSKRARDALKTANPLTEGILAKVLGNQVRGQSAQ